MPAVEEINRVMLTFVSWHEYFQEYSQSFSFIYDSINTVVTMLSMQNQYFMESTHLSSDACESSLLLKCFEFLSCTLEYILQEFIYFTVP